jgi:large subunit ribosomal protein L25
MAAKIEFTAFPRQGGEGRGASRRLRRSGKAPGIVYGGTGEPTQVELDHNALMHALKSERFHASILTMKLGDKSQQVLLRDVQMHPYRPLVLHIDFQRVDANKKIHMKVPLHFINAELSPAVKEGGAVVSHVLNEIDISCLPEGPAGVHRGRPVEPRAEPRAQGVGPQAPARRRGADPRQGPRSSRPR